MTSQQPPGGKRRPGISLVGGFPSELGVGRSPFQSGVSMAAAGFGFEQSLATSLDEVLEDLRRTPFLRDKFSPDSLEHLASGGMGDVFAGWEPGLERWRAIKVMSAGGALAGSAAFRGEAMLLAKLRHPHLLPIHDYGETAGGRPFFTLDLVPGSQTLGEELADYYRHVASSAAAVQWRSRENPLLRFFLEALAAVDYLHHQGVVHRDLKPGNILISSGEEIEQDPGKAPQDARASLPAPRGKRQAYVTDFGLSLAGTLRERVDHQTVAEQLGQRGAENRGSLLLETGGLLFAGTIEYAAPEQARPGGQLSPRTDVYQLGLILRSIVCGQQPFEGQSGNRLGLLEEISRNSGHLSLYGDPRQLNPALQAELYSILDKALAADPQKRYADAGELKRDVEAYLDNRSVRAHRESLSGGTRLGYATQVAAKQTVGWVLSHRGVSATLLAATIGTGVGVNGLLRSRNREAKQRMAELREQEELKRVELEVNEGLQRVQGLRESASKWAIVGNLEAAVAQVSEETLNDLRRRGASSSKLTELVELLEKETAERQAILDMRLFEMKGYMAGIVNDNPADIGPFDKELLLKALEQFIPGGLTDESLEAFRKKMSESGYSQEQRMEIAAGIARISLVLMVEDMETIPWDQELDPKIRRDFLKTLEVLHKFCEACGVKHRDVPGRYEVPTSLRDTEASIKVSLGEDYELVYPNAEWPTDYSGTSVVILPDLRAKVFLAEHLKSFYERLEVETNSFILNTEAVCALMSLKPNLLRFVSADDMSNFSKVVGVQLSAYRHAKELGMENYNLAIRFVKLMTSMTLSSRSIPVTKRPALDKLLLEAREVVSDLEERYPQANDSLEVQKLKCLLSLIPATPLSEKAISVVASIPGHREEGAYLLVWQQALAGVAVNREAGEVFLGSEFSARDPIVKSLVLHGLGRNEEAFECLEQLVEDDETWRYDLLRKANADLKGLKMVDEKRYGALMPFLD